MSASESAQNWPRIAVVGAGAVGGYFGGMLARAGAQVTFIGRPAFVDAVRENGLFLDTVQFRERVTVQASTDLTTARDAGIILFCVKTTDTTETARALGKVLSNDAVVVSMQNGVDNAEQIRAASGLKALPAAVYVAASVFCPGNCKTRRARRSGSRSTERNHATRGSRVQSRQRPVPHLGKSSRRTLDQAGLELRSQRALCARQSDLRRNSRQRRCKTTSRNNGLRSSGRRKSQRHPTCWTRRCKSSASWRLQSRGTNGCHTQLHRSGHDAQQKKPKSIR